MYAGKLSRSILKMLCNTPVVDGLFTIGAQEMQRSGRWRWSFAKGPIQPDQTSVVTRVTSRPTRTSHVGAGALTRPAAPVLQPWRAECRVVVSRHSTKAYCHSGDL